MNPDTVLSAFLGQCASHSNGVSSSVFGLLLQTLLAAQCALNPPGLWPPDYGPALLASKGVRSFDFIVVGAGTAGSVVASRLSEEPSWNVLLIEAGDDPNTESEIPLFYTTNFNSPRAWSFFAERSNFSGQSLTTGSYYPAGRMLGGTSGLNGMVYTRGNQGDYDHWRELGNSGWGWKDVLQYFKKSENMTDPGFFERNGYEFHSQDGPQKVGRYYDTEALTPYINSYLEAARERGYNTKDDYNDGRNAAFYSFYGTLYRGRRQSSAKAFLGSTENRSNLFIVKNALATRIVVENKRAVGVEFEISTEGGVEKTYAEARKEVIVSAGTFKSPQLLQLSGIGRASQLKKLNIPVLQDLPVGFNLQDQTLLLTFFQGPEDVDPLPGPNDSVEAYFQYLTKQTGLFSGIGSTNVAGIVDSKNKSGTFPDLELIPGRYARGGNVNGFGPIFGYPQSVIDVINNALNRSTVYSGLVVLLHQKIPGRVELVSDDPHDAPKITSNLLASNDDVEAVVRGIRIFRELFGSDAFKSYGLKDLRIPFPECEKLTYDTDPYWICYARQLASTAWHQVGTCKMGPKTDPEAVVDSELRVKGVKGLRVVNAAVMPKITSSHTMAPTIMIAEKASDMIRELWSQK